MFVGLIRNKLLAVILGPAGVGLFAQLMGVQNLASGLVPMGMQTGALKYIAKYRSQDSMLLARFVASASKLFLALSVITTLACLVLIKPIAGWTLDTRSYYVYLIPALLGIPFIVQSQLWLTYVQAGLEVKSYSKALVVTSVVGLITVIPLVLLWQQSGAAVHLLLFAFIGYVIARIYANRSMTQEMIKGMKSAAFDFQVALTLFRFGAANLPVFAFMLLVPFLVRTQIVNDLGFTANGIYQAVYAISSTYLSVPLTAMTTYSFPRISQLSDIKEINAEVNNAVKTVMLFATAAVLCVLLTRDILISILFSRKFLPAVTLFPLQMLGDLFRSITWAVQMPTLPQERFRARVVLATVQAAIFLGVFYSVAPGARLFGAVLGHAAAWGVSLVAHYIYMNRVNGYRFTRDNTRLLVTSVTAVALVAYLPFPQLNYRLLSVLITVIWLATAMTRSEITQLKQMLRSRVAS